MSAANVRDPEKQTLALPFQAMLVAFVSVMIVGPVYLIWFLLQGFDGTRPWAWVVLPVGAVVELVVLRRVVRRASQVGFLLPEAQPFLTAALTTVASASLWLRPLLPGLSGPRGSLDRHAVGLDVAVPAFLILLGAWLGLVLSRRRAGSRS